MIELGQTPVDESELSLVVVDHHVVRLDVSVHNSIGVAKVQSLQQFEDVIADVVVEQGGVQDFEVRVVDVLEYQGGGLGLWVADDIQQFDDIRPSAEVLKDLDLPFDLLLLYGLENFDDTFRSI